MKHLKYFLGFICAISSLSCTTTDIPVPEPPTIVETITYNDDIKTIIDGNCIGCHSSTGSASFLQLTNFSQVRNSAENGPLIARMNNSGNPMPPSGKLAQSTLDLVDKWKADGFLEN